MSYKLWDVGFLGTLGFLKIFMTLVVGIFTIFVFIFLKYAYRRYRISTQLPGPKYGFFDILGTTREVENLKKKSSHGNPNIAFQDVIKYYTKKYEEHNFFCIWLSFTPFIIFVKPEGLEVFLTGTKHLSKGWDFDYLRPVFNDGLVTSNGQKWKTRRRMLTPALHFEILKDYLPIFNNNSQSLVKVLKKETKEDFIEILKPVTLCILDIVCETILGVQINAQDNGNSEYVNSIHRVSNAIMERVSSGANVFYDAIYYFTKAGRLFKKDVQLLHNFTDRIIYEKKQQLLNGQESAITKKRKALMDILLESHMKTKELSEGDIREEVDTFAFAGHDTSSSAISWALFLIGHNKIVQNKLYEEIYTIFGDDTERPVSTDDLKDMQYLDRVLKESQRIYPTTAAFTRVTTEDVEICGYKIPSGILCTIHSYQIHRNEKIFPDPEKFDPDRFLPENCTGRHPYAYLPFSAGPRNCIGQRFAMMVQKVVISTVLRNFSVESIDSRDKVIPVIELTLRSIIPIRIRLKPRHTTETKASNAL